jgi:hypothetical protein
MRCAHGKPEICQAQFPRASEQALGSKLGEEPRCLRGFTGERKGLSAWVSVRAVVRVRLQGTLYLSGVMSRD